MKTAEINVDIWQEEELWRYRIKLRVYMRGSRVAEEEIVARGFSDDFDELLGEALAEAKAHAAVLRDG